MANHEILEIPVENLLLDVFNPRHDILTDEDAALREMLNDQGDKLVNLARDIIREGINPSELPIVVPEENGSNFYVVLEGNRRIAAIKLLLNPTLAALSQKRALQRQFEEFAAQFNKQQIDELSCVVFERKEDATHWIQLKHTGENKGVGVVSWDAKAIARFNERLGKPSLALQVTQFVRQNAVLDDDTKKNIENIPLTNLDRLMTDPQVREALGIRLQGKELVSDLPRQEVLKGLTKVVKDVANKKINVNNIRSKVDRQDYLQTFKPNQLPRQNVSKGQTWSIQSPSPHQTTAPTRKSAPLSINRRTLIPGSCIMKIRHHRLNAIYRELKLIDVEKFPNSSAVMLRVFLELSVDEFIANKSVTPKGTALYHKLQGVADYLESNNKANKNQLKAVRVASSNPDPLFSTNTLNAYVHNKDFAAKPSEIKTTWDNMQFFVEKLWE